MKRRSALRGMMAAGVLSIQPLKAIAKATTKKLAVLDDKLQFKARFAAALERMPLLLGYATAERSDYHTSSVQRRGNWPAELRGSLYRNGPGRHEIGEFRYHHWFDGDGMLQAFHLREKAIEHRARIIRTRKYTQEQAAGRALYAGFGTSPPDAKGVSSPDQLNVANISVLAHHSKLFALWEAGSPYEVDAQNLDTIGEHAFSSETSGVPFSAHPKLEPDGNLWNFGYVSNLKKLVLWHLNASGAVVKTGLVDCDPISMVHDFMVTKRHLVLLVCPLHFNPEKNAATFLDAHEWHPDRATQVLIIDKNDFAKVQRLDLPAQWLFHFSNAWEDNNGIIRFEAARAPDPSVLYTTFRDIMQGEITPASPTHLYSYRIDTRKGTLSEEPLRDSRNYEFPVVSPHLVARQHRQLLLLSERQSPHSGLNEVTLIDLQKQKEQSFRYADHLIPEEHLLVGTPGRTGDLPWVLGTALNCKKVRTELFLFRSNDLKSGPLASAELPYALPLGLHGKFVNA